MRLTATRPSRSRLARLLAAIAVASIAAGEARAASPCVAAADRGQSLKSEGKLRDARASFIVCSQRTCNAVVRADCEKWLAEVDEQMPSVVVRAVDARGRDVLDAEVTIDDSPVALDGTPVQIDPGQRVIRARAKSGDVAEQRTLVTVGRKARVIELRFDTALEQDGTAVAGASADATATKPRDEGGGTSTIVPRVLAGVGVVALGVFAGFEIAAQSGYSDLKDGCGRTAAKCTPEEIDPVRQQFVIAGVGLGVSLAAFAAAAIVYLTQRPAQKAARFDRAGAFTF